MWWSEDQSRRGVVMRIAPLLLGAGALAGCGFRPVYGRGVGTGGGALFGAVTVDAPRGELGFRLKESLLRRFGPPESGAPLTLSVTPEVKTEGLAVTQTDAVTRYNLTMTVDYRLTRGGTLLESGVADAIAAYNATASQYATLVSRREVEARAASEVADKIVKRLAARYDPAWAAQP